MLLVEVDVDVLDQSMERLGCSATGEGVRA